MQHQIQPEQHGPRGQVMADAVSACVHCGFCLAACPTYRVLGEEMDSPRGRIVLMKGVLEGALTATEAAPYVDRCLGCLGCVPACPSGVPYGDLLLSYRARVAANHEADGGAARQLTRRLIVETLPYPGRFRRAAQVGRLGRFLAGALPAEWGAMLRLLPDGLPHEPPPPKVYPAVGPRRARAALLVGCVQQVLEPGITWSALRVLAANGVETVIPPGQQCCGSILMHMGETARAMALARANLAAFAATGAVDAVITTAAGCGSGMKEYGLLFRGEPEAEGAVALAAQTRDLAEFLLELGPLSPGPLPEPLTVVYQDACHLRHAQGVEAAPRQLLAAIPNLTLRELGDGGLCCGSAGTYNLEQPALAAELGRRKAAVIQASGAEAVVSGNIGCLAQLGLHLREAGADLPCYHTAQVLDWAYAL